MENKLIYETYLNNLSNSGYSKNTISMNIFKNISYIFRTPDEIKDTEIPKGLYRLIDILNYYCLITILKLKNDNQTILLLQTYSDYVKNKNDIMVLLTEKEKSQISIFTSVVMLSSVLLMIKYISKKIKDNTYIKGLINKIINIVINISNKISSIRNKEIDINKYSYLCKKTNTNIDYSTTKIKIGYIIDNIGDINKSMNNSDQYVYEYILGKLLSVIFINIIESKLILYYTEYFPTGYSDMLKQFIGFDLLKIIKNKFNLNTILTVSSKRLINIVEKYTIIKRKNSKPLSVLLIIIKSIMDIKEVFYETIIYLYFHQRLLP